MTDSWIVILGLAAGTFAVRMTGVLLGHRLPTTGAWARALNALPGCLIVSLVVVSLAQGGVAEWAAGAIAAGIAIVTRSLPLTMVAGISAVVVARMYF